MTLFNSRKLPAPVQNRPSGAYKTSRWRMFLLPFSVFLGALFTWYFLVRFNVFPSYAMPGPGAVASSFVEDFKSGSLLNDIVASLWRVAVGFVISAVLGIPAGLWLGQHLTGRQAFLPMLNFFRFLSPLAWIPFAILWFHIGDKPAVFLIFMATFFPLALATMSAVATIPAIYFRVAKDYNYKGVELLTKVTFPAVLPQVITALRVSYGIAWVVIVAAEMVGCQDGLGYGIWEARNGLRLDSAACYMVVIGLLGMGIDRFLLQFSKLPNVRWGYER
ncbi:ABC transporter permease [Parafilimonas terrae]|uniref:NitT/TauT family transport system permease protein n=1 Tax=Parafilimonas terrae TaxID=1465490 RepID=A0A1I5XTN3_9BACT|nr:ABC transporter permease [Parafilimonas terrae]SFQ35341.1 NitT/TauT family transport system permease protein [Parafilimonas terrae]